MPEPDDRDPRLVDLARAFADQCMVVRQRPEPGVVQRVTFPDGSVGERLEGDPDNDGVVIRIDARWRVTEGDNMARQWLEAEQRSMDRAVEHVRTARLGTPWHGLIRESTSLAPPSPERVSVRGDTMTVSLWYPRNDEIKRIVVDLMDVRAADSLTLSYDFDRDGWAIARDVTRDEDGVAALTGEVREVAFVPAWTDWATPEGSLASAVAVVREGMTAAGLLEPLFGGPAWTAAGVTEGIRRAVAWLRDHGHEALADELEHET